jgi:hypothetical protein
MPLYRDVHTVESGVTAADAAHAHLADHAFPVAEGL